MLSDGFLIGPAAVLLAYGLHRWKPHWQIEYNFGKDGSFDLSRTFC